MCKKVCPNNFNDFISISKIKSYYGKHTNIDKFEKSSSGGAFSALCELLVSKGYVVFGTKYDKKLKVIVDSANSIETCESFCKSKYVQSNTNNCFTKVISCLEANQKVLFSGTSCQISALKQFLKEKKISDNNLLTVSILCHGVPNQKLFDLYLKEIMVEKKSEVVKYTFKSKLKIEGKANTRSADYFLSDGREFHVDKNSDPYLKGFYSRLFLRPACYHCVFARQERVADITLGDAWGIEKIFPELNPVEGLSFIMTATTNGENVMADVIQQSNFDLKEIDAKWAIKSQNILLHPPTCPKKRTIFFQNLKKYGFSKAVTIATTRHWLSRICRHCIGAVKSMLCKELMKVFNIH